MAGSDQAEAVAPIVDLDTQTALDVTKILVQLAADIGQLFVVFRFKRQIEGFGVLGQKSFRSG